MLDILFLNPAVYFNKTEKAHFERDWSGGEVPTSIIYPNLDLAYAAALLRQNGAKVDIIDANALCLSHNQVLKIIAQKKPSFVAIPSSWPSFPDDLRLAKMIKGSSSSVKIIISGPNVTAEPLPALDSGFIDYVVLGEIENPCLEIITNDINYNIAYKSNNNLIIKERRICDDLDAFPFPARDLLPNDKYWAPFTRSNPFTMIFASRGCPHKCIFCPSNIWYMNKLRFRSTGNILDEIREIIDKYNIRDIIFKDLSLTINKNFCFSLCEGIIARGFKINWRCFSCVDTVDKELLTIMNDAGCYQISYGIESGSQNILDMNKKRITISQITEAIRLTKETGIEAAGSFIFGLYGDTLETVKQTLRFALGLGLDYAQFQLAIPIPATEFYDICKKENFIFGEIYGSRWNDFKTVSYPWLANEALQAILKQAYREFYFRYPYIYSQIVKTRDLRQFATKMGAFIRLLRGIK